MAQRCISCDPIFTRKEEDDILKGILDRIKEYFNRCSSEEQDELNSCLQSLNLDKLIDLFEEHRDESLYDFVERIPSGSGRDAGTQEHRPDYMKHVLTDMEEYVSLKRKHTRDGSEILATLVEIIS